MGLVQVWASPTAWKPSTSGRPSAPANRRIRLTSPPIRWTGPSGTNRVHQAGRQRQRPRRPVEGRRVEQLRTQGRVGGADGHRQREGALVRGHGQIEQIAQIAGQPDQLLALDDGVPAGPGAVPAGQVDDAGLVFLLADLDAECGQPARETGPAGRRPPPRRRPAAPRPTPGGRRPPDGRVIPGARAPSRRRARAHRRSMSRPPRRPAGSATARRPPPGAAPNRGWSAGPAAPGDRHRPGAGPRSDRRGRPRRRRPPPANRARRGTAPGWSPSAGPAAHGCDAPAARPFGPGRRPRRAGPQA